MSRGGLELVQVTMKMNFEGKRRIDSQKRRWLISVYPLLFISLRNKKGANDCGLVMILNDLKLLYLSEIQ